MLGHAVIRWVLAACIAMSITAVLFVAMTKMIDGSFILDRMMRIFPLEQTPLVDPCVEWEAHQTLIPIEGVVGYYADDGFVPLADADLVGEHAPENGQQVDISPAGVFRFVTGFADERPAACGEDEGAAAKRLIIEASGCERREIPVTRSWIPHRVLLRCEART